MLAIFRVLCECVKSFRLVVGTVGSSVNALAKDYLKELATVDKPVDTVSLLWLRCYMKEGANSSGAKVDGLGLEFHRSRLFVDESTDQCKAESSSRRDRDRPYERRGLRREQKFREDSGQHCLWECSPVRAVSFSTSRGSGLLRALQLDEACPADEQERPAETRRPGYETGCDN